MSVTVADLHIRFHADTAGAVRGIDIIQRKMGEVGGSMRRIGEVALGGLLQKGIEGGIRAIAGLGSAMFGTAMEAADLNSGISGIVALAGGGATEVEQLKTLISDLGMDPNLKVSSVEAAGAIQELIANGLTLPDVMNGAAESTVLLANSTGAQFTTAATVATDTMAIFGIQAEDMMTAVNGITGVVNASKFSIDDYGLALAQGGGVAATVGVSFEDFNTSITAMSSLFSSGSDAGTSFKTMLQRLIPQSDDAAAMMKKLGLITADGGLVFYDANGQMKDMAEIVGYLNHALGGLSEAEKNAALTILFGSDAMRAAAGLAGMTEEEFRRLQTTIGNTNAMESARTRVDNLKGDMEIFSGVLESVRLKIGDKFQPALRTLYKSATSLLSNLSPMLIGAAEGLASYLSGTAESLTNSLSTIITTFQETGRIELGDWLKIDVPQNKYQLKFGDWFEWEKMAGKTKLTLFDWFELERGQEKTILKFGDWFEWEKMAEKTKLTLFDWFELERGQEKTILKFGDWFEIEQGKLAFDATAHVTRLTFQEKPVIEVIATANVTHISHNGLPLTNLSIDGVNLNITAITLGLGLNLWSLFSQEKLQPGEVVDTSTKVSIKDLFSGKISFSEWWDGLDGKVDLKWPETPADVAKLLGWEWPSEIPSEIAEILGWGWPEAPEFISKLMAWVWPAVPAVINSLLYWEWPGKPEWLDGLMNWTWPSIPTPAWMNTLLSWSPFGGSAPGQNASGTDYWRGGWTWVGEKGPELVNLPHGAQVFSNQDSMQMIGQLAEGTTTPPKPTGVGGNFNIAKMLGQNFRAAGDDVSKKLAKAMKEAAKEFEQVLRGIPGLFGASQVTPQQMKLAELGVPQNFADDYLRRLTDEVLNGADWAGVDIQDAAKRAGIDPTLPATAILELFSQAWNDSSLFANPENLDLINQQAVQEAMARQTAAKAGENNLLKLFGITPEQAQGQAVALGGVMRDGITQGLASPGASATGAAGGSTLLTGLTSMTEEQFGQAGATIIDGLAVAMGKAEYVDKIGGIIPQLLSGFLDKADALTAVTQKLMENLASGIGNVRGIDFVGRMADAIRFELSLESAINALEKVGAQILEIVYRGYTDAAKDKDWGSGVNAGGNAGGGQAPGQNASGTPHWRGGLTWVGEQGPELVSLPRGSRIYNNADSLALAGAGGGNTTVYVTVNANVSNDLDVQRLAYQVADVIRRRR